MTALTIEQLMAATPSGVSQGVTPLNVPNPSWLINIIANAGNLPVTSWVPGGVAWQEMLAFAQMMAINDVTDALRAQGALLDFAATGTVTYVDINGNSVIVPVTPDPSIPAQNSTGALGWLDALADSVYDTDRIVALYAGGTLYLVNTSGASFGSYAPGTFHAANSYTGATYKNVSTFSYGVSSTAGGSIFSYNPGTGAIVTNAPHGLSTGAIVYISGLTGATSNWAVITVTGTSSFTMNGVSGGTIATGFVAIPQSQAFTADLIGPQSNAGPGQVTVTTSSVPGGFVSNVSLAWSGSGYESNVALAARCRARLQSLSVNGPKGAYVYYALTAGSILAAQTPPSSLTSQITRTSALIQTGTGLVQTTVANVSGPVPGVSNLLVTGATNASPVVLTVASTTGITTGMTARVQGITGNTAANGTWIVTVSSGTNLSLNGSTGNGSYVSGGVIEAGDLGLVDSVIQEYAVPNAVTAQTVSATALTVDALAVIYVPLASLNDYGINPASNKGTAALIAYFPTVPIGGVLGVDFLPSSAGVMPLSEVVDIIFQSGRTSAGLVYTISVASVLLNGVAGDVIFSPGQVAIPGTLTVQAIGV